IGYAKRRRKETPRMAASAESASRAMLRGAFPPSPVFGTPGVVAARTTTGTPADVRVPATAPVGTTAAPVLAAVAPIVPGIVPIWNVLPTEAAALTSHVTESRSAVPCATVSVLSNVIVLVPLASDPATFTPLLTAAFPVRELRTRQSERFDTEPPPLAVIVTGSDERRISAPERMASS